MLTHLTIRNLAITESIDIEFKKGMHGLETGFDDAANPAGAPPAAAGAAGEDLGEVAVRVAVAIGVAGAVDDHGVIEQVAVAVGSFAKLGRKSRQ